jgi:hypothetical protein
MTTTFKEFLIKRDPDMLQEIASGSWFNEPTPNPAVVAAMYNGPFPGNGSENSKVPFTNAGKFKELMKVIGNFLPVYRKTKLVITKSHSKF